MNHWVLLKVNLFIPGRGNGLVVIVVDCHLLPGQDLPLGDQSDYQAIPGHSHQEIYQDCLNSLGMIHAAPDRVW